MTEYQIRHVSFAYSVETPDPVRPGETIYVERKAYQGEVVDIELESDIERGLRFDAFVTDETPLPATAAAAVEEVAAAAHQEMLETAAAEAEPEEVEESSVEDMSDEELVTWIKDSHPNINTVVDAAEGDADNARRLLEAEDKATGGDSRQGVVKGLTHIIDQAE
jgi:hypothetical protein